MVVEKIMIEFDHTGLDSIVEGIKNIATKMNKLGDVSTIAGNQIRKNISRVNQLFADTRSLENYDKKIRFLGKSGVLEKLNIGLTETGKMFDKNTNKAVELKNIIGRVATSLSTDEIQKFNAEWNKFDKNVTKSNTKINKFSNSIQKLRPSFAQAGLSIDKNGTILDKHTRKVLTVEMAHKKMKNEFGEVGIKIRNATMRLNHFSRELDKTRLKTNSAKESLGRFKMELLGIMFFGMAMAGFFTGLLQPAMDAFGVFDLFSIVLLMLFLPAAQKASEGMLGLLDTVDKLSPGTKEMISSIALLGVTLGGALFVFGQFALGIDSLIKLYKATKAWSVLTAVSTTLASMSFAVLIGWILVIIAFIAVLFVMWKHNFGGIRDFTKNVISGILNIFKGLLFVVMGIFKMFVGLLEGFITGDFTMFKDGISDIIEGIKLIFLEGFGKIVVSGKLFIINLVKDVLGGFVNLLDMIITKITGKQSDIKAAFWGMLPDWMQDIIKGISGLASGIQSKIKDLVGIDTPTIDVKLNPVDGPFVDQGAGAVGLPGAGSTNVFSPVLNISGDFTDRGQATRVGSETEFMLNELYKKNIQS